MTNIFSFLDYLPSIGITPVMIAKFFVAIVIVILTKTVIVTINPLLQNFCQKNNFDHHSCYVFTKIVRYLFITIGFTIALQNLGIDVSMLVAAFGITGFLVTYGVKDIVANFIASILIVGYQQLKIDDYVRTKDWQGRVIDINLRYTTLQFEDQKIIIPNIVLYTQAFSIQR